MRTTISFDDALVDRAQRLTGLMEKSVLVALACLSGMGVWAGAARADEAPLLTFASAGQLVAVVSVAGGLQHPWSLAFLPEGGMLVTEREGRLRRVSPEGVLSAPIDGLPPVHAQGQGGLLDVLLDPDHANNRRLYLAYAEPTGRGARTAVASAVLAPGSNRLTAVTRLFAQNEDPSGRHHWGARLVFDAEGHLFVTLGDRFFHRDRAQALDSHLGKIVRIRADGSVPEGNPFVGQSGALPEIWSYGHRNVQGAALHPHTGELWAHEHGPQGGDEVNRVKRGGNHGWPVITYGREYVTGARIGEGRERADVVAPLHQWTPSIAPSGMSFYTATVFPGWQGDLFVGALRGQHLARLSLQGAEVVSEERLLEALGVRIRDVRQGPDGLLYLLDDSEGRILRLQPGSPNQAD